MIGICLSSEAETPGMTGGEHDAPSCLSVDSLRMSVHAKLNNLALDNPMIVMSAEEASRSVRSSKQGVEVNSKNDHEILANTTHNDVSIRVALSSKKVLLGTPTATGLAERSTRGGVIPHGSHLLRFHSQSQTGVAQSRNSRMTMG